MKPCIYRGGQIGLATFHHCQQTRQVFRCGLPDAGPGFAGLPCACITWPQSKRPNMLLRPQAEPEPIELLAVCQECPYSAPPERPVVAEPRTGLAATSPAIRAVTAAAPTLGFAPETQQAERRDFAADAADRKRQRYQRRLASRVALTPR